MKLERVICDAVENIAAYTTEQTFDFIYCRHVIEHLVDPCSLLKECAALLSERGVFVVQCPNGLSKEGVLFPNYWKKFLRVAMISNNWSRMYATVFSLSRQYGWGIDPIRHLWAISGKGIAEAFRGDARYDVRTRTASLADPVFSPYWQPCNTLERAASHISRLLAGRLFQGMHLVAEIRRRKAS